MASYEKDPSSLEKVSDDEAQYGAASPDIQVAPSEELHRSLKGRHMQMIAIGGSIGAGLFVGTGTSFNQGGPGSVLIGFMIVGLMLLFTVQALGELAVLYPVNGAFYSYAVRFIDPSWGFAMGWDYALGWLIVLPFEITAAGITISYWRDDINIGVWIAVFLTILAAVQIFGVRGYGEVEFVLSIIKVIAIIGFIIFGIVVDCGGVSSDTRGYIGAHYWHDPGAFKDGFRGFCSVFVNAAFAFGGTELVGLAAAEAADPRKSLPKATRQVFWRITLFYVLSLFIVGLIVPSNSPDLLGSSGANTKASPFVLAIKYAGVKGLPSVFNAVITISVISVANSCTFGSTRTMQALAKNGMGPKFLMYIDKHGRPLWCVLIQICFGFLAFINEANVGSTVFTWLLSLSGLSYFFVWGSICLSHIRFRHAWKLQGHALEELPYQAQFGIIGSYLGFSLNVIALIATFYTSLYPPGSSPSAQGFFEVYLAGPVVIFFYLIWKVYTRGRGGMYVKLRDMDLNTGRREFEFDPLDGQEKETWLNLPYRTMRNLF
ncbi:MAG: hypothetical protein M1827_005994 [Pycnora praestabilis]|nr:MAG: hypothetical protein M1827_005994 [Pycnora praestabilis]